MKKISLFLLTFILCGIGYVGAQTSLPEPSTGDDGPWYYIRVLGKSGDARADRVLAGSEHTGYEDSTSVRSPLNQIAVAGTLANDSMDIQTAADKQLWRVEKTGDEYTIINKFFGKQMGLYYWADTDHWYWRTNSTTGEPELWGEQDKVIPVLQDAANTKWRIQPSGTYNGYFQIIATNPIECASDPTVTYDYLHQGNKAWKFRNIMEKAQWGGDPESAYEFVLPDDMLMTVLPREMNFGTIKEGQIPGDVAEDSVMVTVYTTLAENIYYGMESGREDFSIYVADDSEWDVRKGGKLTVLFPMKKGEDQVPYSDNIIISAKTESGKDLLFKIPISGEYIAEVPFQISSGDNEHWYYIAFRMRGALLVDKGEKQPVATQEYREGDDSQLWKVIDTGLGSYKFISKAGRQLVYIPSTENDEEGAITDRWYAVTTLDDDMDPATFGVDAREDLDWQIRWEEGEGREDSTDPTIWHYSYINKTNDTEDDLFTAYAEMPSDGSAVKFYPASTTMSSGEPVYSNNVTTHWYQIQFLRQSSKVLAEVDQNETYGTNVLQVAKQEGSTAQYWKFMGERTEFYIVNYSGKKLKHEMVSIGEGTESRIVAVDGDGDAFTINHRGHQRWVIKENDEAITGSDPTHLYFNDFGGGGNKVGLYGPNDKGAVIVFTPVTITGIEDINEGKDAENVNDPIVGTTYYTIQGLQVGSKLPEIPGIYIKKNTHTSKKVSAEKILVQPR
ncbi:MAG: hypothetical protein LIO93_08935 [Bacteroidales bacterium]|nr:hypothetical protein [Bacteroidales bacterium]